MGDELALIADREATMQEWAACAGPVLGGSQFRVYEQVTTQICDPDGRGVLAYWPARYLENRRAAVQAVGDLAATGAMWTDVALPYADPVRGRAVAEAVADVVGGVVVDRSGR